MTFKEKALALIVILEATALPTAVAQDPSHEPPRPGNPVPTQKARAESVRSLELSELELRKMSAMSRAGCHADDVRRQFASTGPRDTFATRVATAADVQAGLDLLQAQGLDPEAESWV
jgi:hypothetical protein